MEKVEDKRTAILNATLRLISENGFHGTVMSNVTKEPGLAPVSSTTSLTAKMT